METREIKPSHTLQDPLQRAALELAARLPGKVVLPIDDAYETARLGWNMIIKKSPSVIVYAETPQDVSEALAFAHQQDLKVVVQATGHRETVDGKGTIQIDTSRMQDLKIDHQARTAWVGAGVKWGPVLAQAYPHGLAPLVGSTTDVGVVGYTLSGGMGWLCRKYGMSVDSVNRIEVVTPDGVFRTASPEENPDLFWALSGGGGGFGVVTGMEIRLHPVGQVYAGNLFYPPSMAKEIYRRYREWIKTIPDELTCSIVLFNFPPVDVIPEPLRGNSFVLVRGCYTGPVEEGEKLLSYWRDWQAPVVDDFRSRPFIESDVISMDPVDPMPALLSGEWIQDLSDETAEALIEHTFIQDGPPLFVFTEVRLAGGAVSRIDPDSNAYSHRDQKLIWYSVALLMDTAVAQAVDRQLKHLRAALKPALTGKVYLNFIEGAEMRARTRDGYSEKTFQRLQQLKARYDPDYRFVSSFDISPAKS